jgi:hypothetical protein
MVKSHRRYAVRKFVMFGMITFCLTLGGAALVSVFGNRVGHSLKVGHSGFPGCALILHWPDQTRVDRGPIVVGESILTKHDGGVINIDASTDNSNIPCNMGVMPSEDLIVSPDQ